MDVTKKAPASFRDPSGFVFKNNGTVYRQINKIYFDNYSLFKGSGLYEVLAKKKMLIAHEEVDFSKEGNDHDCLILKPDKIRFISYPYEWCFSQLKDAALLTIDIQRIAMDHGMILKDASAYNVQFQDGAPIFIDTLSFESYIEGRPWTAYRQFCQHFLAPLALMAKRDVRLGQLLRVYIDGIPLDLASKLLPRKTILNLGVLTHLHLHAHAQNSFSESHEKPSKAVNKFSKVSKYGLIGLIEGLRKSVENIVWKPGGTEWGDYYNDTNYSDSSFELKKNLINSFLDIISPQNVWDLGANTGVFSRIASDRRIPTIAFDIDPSAVEINYRKVKKDNESFIQPLLLDLTNPSPGLGWDNLERDALKSRGPVDCVMALALIHHISISNNVPFDNVASFFADVCKKFLIIEFVPKSDSQVKRLLRSREDVFFNYDKENFEKSFYKFFSIKKIESIMGSERFLYLMRKKA